MSEIIDPFSINPPDPLEIFEGDDEDVIVFPYALGFDLKIDPENLAKILEVNGNQSGIPGLKRLSRPRYKARNQHRDGQNFRYRYAVNQYGITQKDVPIIDNPASSNSDSSFPDPYGTQAGEEEKFFGNDAMKKTKIKWLFQVCEWLDYPKTQEQAKYMYLLKKSLRGDSNFLSKAFGIKEWGFAGSNEQGLSFLAGDPINGQADFAGWAKFLQFLFSLHHAYENHDKRHEEDSNNENFGRQKRYTNMRIIELSTRKKTEKLDWYDPQNIFVTGNQFLRFKDDYSKADVIEACIPANIPINQIERDKNLQKAHIPSQFQTPFVGIYGGGDIQTFVSFMDMLKSGGHEHIVVKRAQGSARGRHVHIIDINDTTQATEIAKKYVQEGYTVLGEQYARSKNLTHEGIDGHDGSMRYLVDIVVDRKSRTYSTTFEDGYWDLCPPNMLATYLQSPAINALADDKDLEIARTAVHQTIRALLDNGAFSL